MQEPKAGRTKEQVCREFLHESCQQVLTTAVCPNILPSTSKGIMALQGEQPMTHLTWCGEQQLYWRQLRGIK